jgi:2'-5' RNA ligase
MPKPPQDLIRAFIAIELSIELKQKLDQVSARFRKELLRVPVRWASVRNIHLTLKFLGDVQNTRLAAIEQTLARVAGSHQVFQIGLADWGVFPKPDRPRVIWIGVNAPADLAALQQDVEAGVASLGFTPEARRFTPHLTLGRVSQDASTVDRRAIASLLDTFRVEQLGAMQVEQVCLFRSDLKPAGAIYTRLFVAGLLREA